MNNDSSKGLKINNPWLPVGLLWVVALLNYLDRQMLSTMRPSMQVDIRELESITTFGHLLAVFLWVYGLCSPVAGLVADRFNRKRLIVGSLFVWSTVTLLMGFATNFNQLYILRALMGVSEAIYIPASMALIADFHTGKTRSLANGIHLTGFYIGQALGGFGATVAHKYSWQETFFGFGLFGILYALLLSVFLKEARVSNKQVAGLEVVPRPPFFKAIPQLFTNFSFVIILIYFAVPGIPIWVIKNWLPTIFSENLKLDMSVAGPIATITLSFSALFGVILGGYLTDRWSKLNPNARKYVSAIGMFITIPAFLLIIVGNTLVISILSAIFIGFGLGWYDVNNMPLLCQFVPSSQRSSAYGLMNMSGVLLGAAATSLFGGIGADNLINAFVFFGAIILVVTLTQLYFLRPKTLDFK